VAERDACVVLRRGVVTAECRGVTEVVAGASDVTGGTVVVTTGVTGCVNCEREKPYTVDASTATIIEPSPLTATEPAFIGLLVVAEPSLVPAWS
jgi:hypothetical protein